MQLNVYLRALVRYWYVSVALLAIAFAAVWIYHDVRDQKQAVATVAIQQSIFPAPGEYLPPQIGFDAMDESGELARRVAARLNDGTKPESLKGSITIGQTPRVDPRNPTPLYLVTASDSDGARAKKIANIAVEEARDLFGEINQPRGADVRAAFQTEVDLARLQEVVAREKLRTFAADNDAFALPERVTQLVGLTTQLRVGSLSGGTRADAGSLASANSELARLRSLQPEHERLRFEAGLADSGVARLEQTVEGITTGGSPLASALPTANSQLAAAKRRAAAAHGALDAFLQSNRVTDLAASIAGQVARVDQFVLADASSSAGASIAQRALTTQEQELQRLTSLQTEYEALSSDVTKAATRLASIEQRELDIIIAQALPARAQVKALSDATIQSSLWFVALTYALALFVAVFLAMSTVYLLATFERTAPTVREFEGALGSPVIARIPNASV